MENIMCDFFTVHPYINPALFCLEIINNPVNLPIFRLVRLVLLG